MSTVLEHTEKHARILSRRQLIAAGAVSVSALILARIAWVNMAAPPMSPEAHHEPGTWVELDGCFLATNLEHTDGLAVRLNSAELISYNEFVDRYACDDATQTVSGWDTASILDLDVTLRNDADDESGHFNLGATKLIPRHTSMRLSLEAGLLVATQPSMQEDGNPGMTARIRSHSTYDLHLPYVWNGRTPTTKYTRPITESEFEWYLSNLPVRHLVDLKL